MTRHGECKLVKFPAINTFTYWGISRRESAVNDSRVII